MSMLYFAGDCTAGYFCMNGSASATQLNVRIVLEDIIVMSWELQHRQDLVMQGKS
jgi:hypothetical protein